MRVSQLAPILVCHKPLEIMFPNVYHPVLAVSADPRTAFEDKWALVTEALVQQGEQPIGPPHAAAVHL